MLTDPQNGPQTCLCVVLCLNCVTGQLQGLVMLQNLPSIVAALALNPHPGSRVLDMCAAPGGKTTMLAQIMGGKGQIYALDRSHAKVDDIRSLAAELGCSSSITALKMDATKAVCAAEAGWSQEAAAGADKQQQCHSSDHLYQQKQGLEQKQGPEEEQQHGQLPPLLMSQSVAPDVTQENVQQGGENSQQIFHNGQQHLPQQQQQQHHESSPPQAMSAKAQQRLSRRLAAMAARGHQPSPREFR